MYKSLRVRKYLPLVPCYMLTLSKPNISCSYGLPSLNLSLSTSTAGCNAIFHSVFLSIDVFLYLSFNVYCILFHLLFSFCQWRYGSENLDSFPVVRPFMLCSKTKGPGSLRVGTKCLFQSVPWFYLWHTLQQKIQLNFDHSKYHSLSVRDIQKLL